MYCLFLICGKRLHLTHWHSGLVITQFHWPEYCIFWCVIGRVRLYFYWWFDWHGQWGLGLKKAVVSIGVRESCVPFIRQAGECPVDPTLTPSTQLQTIGLAPVIDAHHWHEQLHRAMVLLTNVSHSMSDSLNYGNTHYKRETSVHPIYTQVYVPVINTSDLEI